MNREQRRAAAKHMAAESAKFGAQLTLINPSDYKVAPPPKRGTAHERAAELVKHYWRVE